MSRNREEKRQSSSSSSSSSSTSTRKRGRPHTGEDVDLGPGKHTKFIHPRPRDTASYATDSSGISGAPGNEFIAPTKNGVLSAHHRTDPAPYQSSVTNTVRILRPNDVYEERLLNYELSKSGGGVLVAPLGNPHCFVTHGGDVLFSVKGDEPEGFRNTDPYGAYVKCSGSVNGLLTTDDIIVQGCKIFDQNANPNKAFNSDDVGTAQVGGTITIHHTGPHIIYQHENVYVSIFPVPATDERGNMIPGITVPGTMGAKGEHNAVTGESEGRFYPALYGWRHGSHSTYINTLKAEIRAIWSAKNPDSITDTSEALSAMEDVQYKISQNMFATAAAELPGRDFANAYIANHLWNLHIGGEASELRAIGEAVLKWTQKIYQKQATASAEYHANLGANGISFTHPCLNPSIVADLMKQDTWESDDVLIQELRPQGALSAWINDACTAADHKQMEYLSSKMLGKSQHTVEPAGSFDVFLGVGNRC